MKQDENEELERIAQHVEMLEDYQRNLEQQIMDVQQLIASLEEFSTLKGGETILLPLAHGIFAKGTLVDKDHLVVHVGSDVAVTKTVAETKALLTTQLEEMDAYYERTAARVADLVKRAEEIDASKFK
ncbi:MAG: prefoldin subunit alpha [Nanoarchaeota archaeon]